MHQQELDDIVTYLTARRYTRVALQFPDDQLQTAGDVGKELTAACKAQGLDIETWVLADSSYNALGVDEVAAEHLASQCVVHFGRASLSPVTRLPAVFALGRAPLDVRRTVARVAPFAAAAAAAAGPATDAGAQPARGLVVVPDQPYCWAAGELEAGLRQAVPGMGIVVARPTATHLDPPPPTTSSAEAPSPPPAARAGSSEGEQPPPPAEEQQRLSLAGYTWEAPRGCQAPESCAWLWLGPGDAPALTQLRLTYSAAAHWAAYDPQTGVLEEGLPEAIRRLLKRRYYLVQKAREANIIGIVMGTLGASGFLAAVERLRALARAAGKRTYTILMGKPTPVKLANFPEIDVFVMVAEAQGQILDSKGFYAPLITPFEAQLALTPGASWTGEYRLDFACLEAEPPEPASSEAEDAEEEQPALDPGPPPPPGAAAAPTKELALRPTGSVAQRTGAGALVEAKTAAEFLAGHRSWRGLDAGPLFGGTDAPAPALATQGRAGRAAGYAGEGEGASDTHAQQQQQERQPL